MRTKALLIAAAAMAAGVVSSQAQVYSQNIVGYVNGVVGNGFSVQNNPFNASNGNALTNVINNTTVSGPGTGPFDGTYVYIWGGHTYAVYTIDSTQPTGVADVTDSYATNAPVINPGTAFFLNNGSGLALTNTYVGTVALTTYPGTTTNQISGSVAFSLVSSILPIGGGVSSVLGLTNVLSAGPGTGNIDGDYIYVPNIINGTFHGYTVTTIDSTQPTGFADVTDSTPAPEPVIPVGGGFFFDNANLQPYTWIQTLNQ